MATWQTPADAPAPAITIELHPRRITLTQGETELVITQEQLSDVADKLYFLDLTFQNDAETIVDVLCSP